MCIIYIIIESLTYSYYRHENSENSKTIFPQQFFYLKQKLDEAVRPDKLVVASEWADAYPL